MVTSFNFSEYLPGIPKSYFQAIKRAILPSKPKLIPGKTKGVDLIGGVLNERGIVASASMTVNDPNVEMVISFDGVEYTATVDEIYTANIERPVDSLPNINAYNPTLGIYSFTWSPDKAFNDNVVVTFNNNAPYDVRILEMLVEIYVFKKGFYDRLADVKSGKLERD